MISQRSCGVYAIVNRVNGKVYVGSTSRSFAKRFRNHQHDLVRGSHHCEPLQRAWEKYGADSFVFRPLEETTPGNAIAAEQAFIDFLAPDYNVAPVAGSARGVRHTPESRRKYSEAQKRLLSQPGYLEKRVAALKASLSTEESRTRRIAAQNRPEVAKARSEASLAMWSQPGFRERSIAAMRRANSQPEKKLTKSRISRERNIAKSPFTREVVRDVQRRLAAGEKGSEIARYYNVGQSSISRIKNGTHWALMS